MLIRALIIFCIVFSLAGKVYTAEEKKDPLAEGKKLPRFTVTEDKKETIFPDDFKGEVFVLYFGNIVNDKDGFQFLSWGGGFTILLRQEDPVLHDVYFAGIASLEDRPLYWVPLLVRKTFSDSMKKHDIRGELFYDWQNEISDKLKIKAGQYRVVIIDKKGVIRRSFDRKIYELPKEEQEKVSDLIKELLNEDVDKK